MAEQQACHKQLHASVANRCWQSLLCEVMHDVQVHQPVKRLSQDEYSGYWVLTQGTVKKRMNSVVCCGHMDRPI